MPTEGTKSGTTRDFQNSPRLEYHFLVETTQIENATFPYCPAKNQC